mgnify:CR=1 FL=1
MKRLNNNGITTIEILICFVLLAVISTSLYNTVSVYRNKQTLEMEKEKIYTYKNLLTKEIQDDIIKRGLTVATKISDTKLTMSFSNGPDTTLEVLKDENKIIYDGIEYPLPSFGKNFSSENVLKIDSCNIEITNSPDFLTINIPFMHPDFGTKYGILVAAPIGYTS